MRVLRATLFSALCLLSLSACFGKDDSAAPEGDTDTDADADTDTDTDTDTTGFPADPSPFDVTVSGAYTGTLTFDDPTCYYPEGSSQLRVFWRNEAREHVFFLLVELLSGFEGAGTYDDSNTSPRAKLQEEAGGSGYYFQSDADQGDVVSLTVQLDEEDHAWGEWTATGLHDTEGGAITMEPTVIPIWCPELN